MIVKGILFALALLGSLTHAEDAVYIGSRTCAGCHKKIYQDYGRTAMGRSMDVGGSPLQNETVPAPASIFSEKLNRHFEVSRQGSALFQTEYEIDSGGREVFRTTHKLEYVVGSGVNGYGYIVRRGQYLFQAPLSYYSRKKAWGLSPGYEFADYGFNRPIAAACIACHSGRPQAVRDRVGLFNEPAFTELAIGCENCHGPGSLHAAKRAQPGSALSGEPDRTIVNPASLPSRLADDICMNCHQGSDTRVLQPGKDIFDFRPGTPLHETLAILRVPLTRDATGESDLLEHHSSMRLSKCYRSSAGRLSCLTCHQIHSVPRAPEAAAYYRGKCLACHTEASCKLPQPLRQEHANDCAGCHMPKRGVEVLSHAVLTNHRIISRPGEPLPEAAFAKGASNLPDLVYFNGPAEGSRESLPPIMLLQAYGELMSKHPEYEQRYLSILDDLAKNGKPQPLVEAALGRKLLQNGLISNSQAIDHLTRAIDLGFKAPTVYQDLAEALLRAGREADAVGPLEEGINIAPYTPVLHKSLALRYINLQRYDAARQALERYVELFPEDDFVRGLLLQVQHADTSGRK